MIFIEPKEIEIDGRKFIISKYPAIAGREIIAGYPLSSIPKLSEYKASHDIMLKNLHYVQVIKNNGEKEQLVTEAVINNHVGSWETLIKLEGKMLEYNCSFFQNGQASAFLQGLAQTIKQSISTILMDSSAQSPPVEKPPFTN